MRRVPKRLVSDGASHKNKELEFQSSGCQVPAPRARAPLRLPAYLTLRTNQCHPGYAYTYIHMLHQHTTKQELDSFLQPVVGQGNAQSPKSFFAPCVPRGRSTDRRSRYTRGIEFHFHGLVALAVGQIVRM